MPKSNKKKASKVNSKNTDSPSVNQDQSPAPPLPTEPAPIQPEPFVVVETVPNEATLDPSQDNAPQIEHTQLETIEEIKEPEEPEDKQQQAPDLTVEAIPPVEPIQEEQTNETILKKPKKILKNKNSSQQIPESEKAEPEKPDSKNLEVSIPEKKTKSKFANLVEEPKHEKKVVHESHAHFQGPDLAAHDHDHDEHMDNRQSIRSSFTEKHIQRTKMMNRESFRMVKKTIVIDQATQTEEQDFLTKGTAALVSSVVTISKQYNPITLVNTNSYFRRFFCMQVNPIFNIKKGQEFKGQNLLNYPPYLECYNSLERFKAKQKELRLENKDTDLHLLQAVWNSMMPDFKWCCIYRCLEQTSSVIFPIMFKAYMRLLTSPSQDLQKALTYITLVSVVNFARNMASQHSFRLQGASKTSTGQILRMLFLQKIRRGNYTFNYHADAALSAKMNFFDIQGLHDLVGNLPFIFAAPISLFFNLFLISQAIQLGQYTYLVLAVFLVSFLAIFLLNKLIVGKRLAMNITSSQRTMILAEWIPNMIRIKLHGLEHLYKSKIAKLRAAEVWNTKVTQLYSTLQYFFFFTGPMLAGLAVIVAYNMFNKRNLDVNKCYLIIVILGNIQGPLLTLATALNECQWFFCAWTSLKALYGKVDDQVIPFTINPDLKPGEIVFNEAYFSINDYVAKKVYEEIMTQKKHKRVIRRNGKLVRKNIYAFERKDSNVEFHVDEKEFDPVAANEEIELKPLTNPNLKFRYKGITYESNAADIDIEKNYSGFQEVLRNISLAIEPGTKVCLVGKKGSGVYSFMNAILGEAFLSKGIFMLNGRISYVSSNHEIYISNSIKCNIILSQKFDRKKFEKVLEDVDFDLSKFPAGSETEVLHNAMNFSLSERRKILLARLLYHGGDIFCLDNFFDDWLPQLSSKLFENIMDTCLKKKTVIYSTSNNVLIRKADLILYFEDGQIRQQGTYTDLLKQHDKGFFKLLVGKKQKNWQRQALGKILEGVSLKKPETTVVSKKLRDIKYPHFKLPKVDPVKPDPDGGADADEVAAKQTMKLEVQRILTITSVFLQYKVKFHKLAQISSIEPLYTTNSVVKETYKYLTTNGVFNFLLIVLLFMISVLLFIASDIWVGIWANDKIQLRPKRRYLDFYIILAGGAALFVIVRDMTIRLRCLAISNKYNDTIMDNITRANMNFFMDRTPARIIYRLSADQIVVDDKLNDSIREGLESIIFIIGGFLILNYVYYGIFVIFSVIAIVILYKLLKFFLMVTVPIVQFRERGRVHVIEYYIKIQESMVSFRGVGNSRALEYFWKKHNNYFQNCLTHIMNHCQRWLGCRIALFNAAWLFVCLMLPFLSLKFFPQIFGTDKNWKIPLGLSWSFRVVVLTSNFVNQLANITNDLISVKRLQEYFDLDKKHDQGKRERKYQRLEIAPQSNAIEFKDVNLTINDVPILRKISLFVGHKERVAIIGDYSSGKHSLFKLIMGMYKFDKYEKIEMETKKTKKVRRNLKTVIASRQGDEAGGKELQPLAQESAKSKEKVGYQLLQSSIQIFSKSIKEFHPLDLRVNICSLDKDSFLVTGTLRENVDPDKIHTQEKIIEGLVHFDLAGQIYKAIGSNKISDMVAYFLGEYSNESYIEPKTGELSRNVSFRVGKNKNQDENVIVEGNKKTEELYRDVLAKKVLAAKEEEGKDGSNKPKNAGYNRTNVEAALVQRLLEDEPEKEQLVVRKSQKDENLKEKRFYDPEDQESVKELYTLLLRQKIVKNGRHIDGAVKKIVLATRVFLKSPEILLIDEDFMTVNQFKGTTIYGRFWRMDATIVSILSDLKNVLLYDRVYILNQGSIIESGSPQQLVKEKSSALYQRLLAQDQKTFRSVIKMSQGDAQAPKKAAPAKKKTTASKSKLNN